MKISRKAKRVTETEIKKRDWEWEDAYRDWVSRHGKEWIETEEEK